jgi:hypothetical protein
LKEFLAMNILSLYGTQTPVFGVVAGGRMSPLLICSEWAGGSLGGM